MKLYESKARIYHDWMKARGKDYKKEAKALAKLIRSRISKGKIKIFDLACGTGENALQLKNQGFEVSCGDLSEEMVSISKNKISSCIKADMRNFKLKNKVNVITCMFNSIFYLKNDKELRSMLKSCYENLKKEGLLVIEITNPEILNKPIKARNSWKLKEYEIIMVSELRPPKLIQEFIIKDSKGNTVKDIHKLHVFKIDKIKELMKKAGFIEIEISGGNNLHILARKPICSCHQPINTIKNKLKQIKKASIN